MQRTKPIHEGPKKLPTTHQWEFTSLDAARRVQEALNKAEGLPRTDDWIRAPTRSRRPPATVRAVDIDKHPDLDRWAIQRNRLAQKHEGKTVRGVPGRGDVTLPDEKSAVTRAAEWNNGSVVP